MPAWIFIRWMLARNACAKVYQHYVVHPVQLNYWAARAAFMAMLGRFYYFRDAPDHVVIAFTALDQNIDQFDAHLALFQRVALTAREEMALRFKRKMRKLRTLAQSIETKHAYDNPELQRAFEALYAQMQTTEEEGLSDIRLVVDNTKTDQEKQP